MANNTGNASSKSGWRAVVVASAFGLVSVGAHAADVEGSSSGVWNDPTPAAATYTGVNTPHFTWGVGAHLDSGQTSAPGSITFTGGAFAQAFETPFKIGSVDYFNGSIRDDSGVTSVNLALDVNFTTPALGNIANNFTFNINETPNVGTPDQQADYLSLPAVFSDTAFWIGSTQYHVKLLGFQNVVGDGYLVSDATQFHVREQGTASADLYAMVTSETLPVPEPDSDAMLLAGLGVMGAMLRRRQRQH